jgi:hypothetical protein
MVCVWKVCEWEREETREGSWIKGGRKERDKKNKQKEGKR